MQTGGNISVTTPVGGTAYTAYASQACLRLTIVNSSGQSIEFARGGTGVGIVVRDGASATIEGITNTNQISVRRSGANNNGEVVNAMWEA
jgi:hypothetical protein